jgi:predicted RNase H-like HicB family nuclease
MNMKRNNCAIVLIYKEDNNWVAHCLDFDLLACARRSPRDAVSRLMGVIRAHIEYLDDNGLLEQLHRPAPREYWNMLREAKPIGIIPLFEKKEKASESLPPIHELARLNIEYKLEAL